MITLYNAYSVRMTGWWTKSGTYTSTRADAQVFTEDEIIPFCKNHVDHNNASTMLPVRVADMQAVEAKE